VFSVSVTPLVGSTITWYSDSNLSTTNQIGTGATVSAAVDTVNTTFYVRVVSGNGCERIDSTIVIVKPTPLAPNLANLTLCEGEAILLTTGTIANGYSWTGPNGYSSALQNPAAIIASPITAGTYTLSIVDADGCTSSSTMQVTVNSLPIAPSISNTGPVCLGDSISLTTSSIITNANYEWFHLTSGNSVGVGTPLNLGTISYVDTGIYYVVVTLNGCSVNSLDSTTVNVFEFG